LWTWRDSILEVGTSNVFILWKNKENELEVVTPEVSDMILPGVTRDSVI